MEMRMSRHADDINDEEYFMQNGHTTVEWDTFYMNKRIKELESRITKLEKKLRAKAKEDETQ
jgi:hypothetical protein